MLPSPEKSVVACFYSRVLFRVPDGEKPIRFIKSASSLLPDFCMNKGLSATGNAASRAGHDFDDIELLAILHSSQNLLCVHESAYDSNLHHRFIVSDLKFLDAFVSSHSNLGDLGDSASALLLHHVSEDSFRNSSGDSEDDASSALSVVWSIYRFRIQV